MELEIPARAMGLLVLGHGAGGDVTAPDLAAVGTAALAVRVGVALVTQPYRVAGRRSPAPAGRLDEAWVAVCQALPVGTGRSARRLPLIVGGRSSGARVACRTAGTVGAAGVVALAFPLHPPGRPERDRSFELSTGLPTLVVNGDRDPFGIPEPAGDREVHVIPGARHDLRRDPAAVASAVVDWLYRHGWAARVRP
ncbi:MAG: alpha/beta hydrolase [Micromonosporaceae bacterium]|nr:alpha/beta hydrolase [Micromonosporaceae bacterium]